MEVRLPSLVVICRNFNPLFTVDFFLPRPSARLDHGVDDREEINVCVVWISLNIGWRWCHKSTSRWKEQRKVLVACFLDVKTQIGELNEMHTLITERQEGQT